MRLPAGDFLIADLNPRGELQLKETYRYEHLVQIPGAADLIGALAGAVWRNPREFEQSLPGRPSARLRWLAAADTAGVASLRFGGELAAVTLLACGLNPDDDRLTLGAFQRHLLRELRDTPYEPAFALLDLHERPLAATINFRSPPAPADQALAALADRCFAAAYFRYHGLA